MLARKQIRSFRRGRVNTAKEVRRQLRIRTNLEKLYYRRINSLLRKWINVRVGIFKEYGIFEAEVATRALLEELEPITFAHYRRVFRTIINSNNETYDLGTKDEEIFIMGRSVDFEALVTTYFATRRIIFSGLSQRLTNRILRIIEQGRADNLTLPQIAKNISEQVPNIARSRAALISRTETHNAASHANHVYHRAVVEDLGITMNKRWVATGDARTRASHSIASGQTVHMDEKFIVGGVPMDFAGDPAGGASNVVNCRCVIVYADEDDLLE